jgi:hypothetical protein
VGRARLARASAGVKRTTLTVLSHLILNDQMKVKGHIASIARLLTDNEDEVGSTPPARSHPTRVVCACVHGQGVLVTKHSTVSNHKPSLLSTTRGLNPAHPAHAQGPHQLPDLCTLFHATLLCAAQLKQWARRFFATLAQRTSGKSGTNPVFNLMPDILSALTEDDGVDEGAFKTIMKVSACVCGGEEGRARCLHEQLLRLELQPLWC